MKLLIPKTTLFALLSAVLLSAFGCGKPSTQAESNAEPSQQVQADKKSSSTSTKSADSKPVQLPAELSSVSVGSTFLDFSLNLSTTFIKVYHSCVSSYIK